MSFFKNGFQDGVDGKPKNSGTIVTITVDDGLVRRTESVFVDDKRYEADYERGRKLRKSLDELLFTTSQRRRQPWED